MGRGLTDKQLAAFVTNPPPANIQIPDGSVDGLTVRVGPRGKPTWTFRFRARGSGGVTPTGTLLNGKRYHRVSLGRYPAVSIAKARSEAAKYVAMLDKGENPADALANAAVDPKYSVRQLVEDFCADYAAGGRRSAHHGELTIKKHIVGAWGDLPAGGISARMAQALVDKVKAGPPPKTPDGPKTPRPGAARETAKWGRQMFAWARKRHRVTVNPFTEIDAPKANRRQHFLTIEEARAVWRAAGELDQPWRAAVRLLMLTACRENEICSARRRYLSPEGSALTIPAERYKTNRAHYVPLAPAAVAEIALLPKLGDAEAERAGKDYFLTTTNGEKPIAGVHRKVVDSLHLRAEKMLGRPIERFRLHDLRRTARTHLPRLGVSEVVGEMVLGHVLRGVQGTYNVYDFADEKRVALEKWATELTA